MRSVMSVLSVLITFAIASFAQAGELATPAEAKQMAEKASNFFKEKGAKELIEIVQNKHRQFLYKDLYVFIADEKGIIEAHGAVPKLKGRNLYNMKDVDGVFLVQEMIKTAKTSEGKGWVNYKWPHPKTKEITDKTSYVIKLTDKLFVGVGAYK